MMGCSNKLLGYCLFCVFLQVAFWGNLNAKENPVSTVGHANKKARPNVLLIVADDMGFSDLGSFGSEIKTPNLDAMAMRGVRMTNFHAAPSCSPTRAMLMSGCDNHTAGLGAMTEQIKDSQKDQPGYEGILNNLVAALPNLLKDAGYHTYMAGKWHLGLEDDQSPRARGFERSFSLLIGGGSHFDLTGTEEKMKVAPYREDGKKLETLPEGFYSSKNYADKMIEYIDSNKDDGKPFFGWLAFTAPHWPLQAPDEFIDNYAGKYDKGFDIIREERLKAGKALGITPADYQSDSFHRIGSFWDQLPQDQKTDLARKMEIYSAMMECMDFHIGRVVSHLKKTGQLENTVIIFMSDNGADGGDVTAPQMPFADFIKEHCDNSFENYGRAGSFISKGRNWAQACSAPYKMWKGFTTEGGIRVPAFMYHPGIKEQGRIDGQLLTAMDVAPTVLELAEAKHPGTQYKGREVAPIQGTSFAGLLNGQTRVHPEDEAIGWELHGRRALFMGDYKAVHYGRPFGSGQWEVYNLKSDPGEVYNLAQSEPALLNEMATAWDDYGKANGVVMVEDRRAGGPGGRGGRGQGGRGQGQGGQGAGNQGIAGQGQGMQGGGRGGRGGRGGQGQLAQGSGAGQGQGAGRGGQGAGGRGAQGQGRDQGAGRGSQAQGGGQGQGGQGQLAQSPGGQRQGGGGAGGGGRQKLINALDANFDFEITEDEMRNAQAAILSLDTNNDGQLTSDEYGRNNNPVAAAPQVSAPQVPATGGQGGQSGGVLPGIQSGNNSGGAGQTHYVTASASSGDGSSWQSPTNLQTALASARTGDEIRVAKGVYYPSDDGDRSASFWLPEGVTVMGGYSGNGDERNWEKYETVLSGDIGKKGDDQDNSYHIVVGAKDAVLDGFTISGANGTNARRGGGGGGGRGQGGPGAGQGRGGPGQGGPAVAQGRGGPGQGSGQGGPGGQGRGPGQGGGAGGRGGQDRGQGGPGAGQAPGGQGRGGQGRQGDLSQGRGAGGAGQGRGGAGQGRGGQGRGGAGQGRGGQGQRGAGGQRSRPPRVPIVLTEGQLPDTNAHKPDGTPIKVRDLIKGKYTVIKPGCLTCPEFLIAYKELEATARDYEKMGVQFYYIYQSLRHPEREGYVQPQNTKERLMHVAEAKERLGTTVPWIMDTIDDSFRVAMRTNSNSIFIIAPDGEIAYAADRMNGDGLRRALIDLVGPVENPTSAQDLSFPEMKRFPPTNITNEIRVERPQGLVILKTTPTKPEDTYYVKLRAEAEKSVLENGSGDLYLGFFPDPIHEAHWNNLTPPMKYELELPEGVTIDPQSASANKGPGDKDTEPRQFKLKVTSDKKPGDIKLKINYFACTPGMCEGLTHEYVIAFEDMDRNSRTYSFNRGQGAPGGIPKPQNRQFGPGRAGGQGGGAQQGRGGQGGAGQGRGQGGQGRGAGGQGRGPGGQGGQGRGGQGGQGRGQAGGGQGQGARGGGPRDRVRPRDVAFNEKFPLGAQLPSDLKIYNVDRKLVSVTDVLKSKYTVMVGGCLTCPAYRSSYPEIEAVARDFSDKGVDFYFVYQTLAHPENWGFVQPTSIEERFAQVEHAKELLQTKIQWLTDPIDNQVKTYFLSTPNSQFVFDQSGKVVHRDSWGRGSSLRESLEKLVGKPATTTSVQNLNLPRFEHHLTSGDTLLPRLKVDGVAVPLFVKAGGGASEVSALRSSDFGELNRYAKLRAEGDQQLMDTGTGKLYLGFRQDPVLGAKWNNLSTPPQYKIVGSNATFSPTTAKAPKLEVESDSEPREFLVDVKDWKANDPIVVKIQYFACNKEKGWCKPVQQEFTVSLEKDETAGMVNGRTHFPGGGRGGAGGQGQGGRGGGGQGGRGAAGQGQGAGRGQGGRGPGQGGAGQGAGRGPGQGGAGQGRGRQGGGAGQGRGGQAPQSRPNFDQEQSALEVESSGLKVSYVSLVTEYGDQERQGRGGPGQGGTGQGRGGPGQGGAGQGRGGQGRQGRGGQGGQGRQGGPGGRQGGGPGGQGGRSGNEGGPAIHITPQMILSGINPGAGAGIVNFQCAPTYRNCIVRDNKARKGGGVYNMSSVTSPSDPEFAIQPAATFINVIFINNYAIGRGGAISNDLGTEPTFIQCTFTDNKCDGKGGAVYNDFRCSPTFISCLFTGNSAYDGGAMGNDGSSSPKITNCTFTKNHAIDMGAALYQGSGPSNNPVVTNSILWGNVCDNGPAEIVNWHDNSPVVTYSCIEGGYPGEGNIDKDPRFVDPANGDYSLAENSPCIDAADGLAGPTKDRVDADRFEDTGIPNGPVASIVAAMGDLGRTARRGTAPADIGAFERQASSSTPKMATVFVNAANNGEQDGRTWNTAFKTIQPAIELAYRAEAKIWVAAGTYKPTDGTDRTASFKLRKGVAMYGGFKGGEATVDQRDPGVNSTLLSGDIGLPKQMGDNSYHVLEGADGAMLDGFQIAYGNANGEAFNAKGGGMINYARHKQKAPTGWATGYTVHINNCAFFDNYANEGGAVYNYDRSEPTFTAVSFVRNKAESGGAIVDRVGVKSKITNCVFSENYAKWRGGAVYFDYGSRPIIEGCKFMANQTDGHGGATYIISRASQLENSVVKINNSMFQSNQARLRGGAIANADSGVLELADCEFTTNKAGRGGGAVSNEYLSRAKASGIKFSGNESTTGEADTDTDESSSFKME